MRANAVYATNFPQTHLLERLRTQREERPHAGEAGAITPALDRSALELLVRRPRRHVLIVEDAGYSGRALANILGRWNFEVVTAYGEAAAAAALEGRERFDLAVVALPTGPAAAQLLAALRTQPALTTTPILAVASSLAGVVDCDALREHGAVGVLGRDASPERIAFRVGQILPLGSVAERRHVRIPVDFAVEVDVDDVRSTQRAENLSMGGIRLRSCVALDVNAIVGLRFRLPLHPAETVEAEARVIHCQPVPGREDAYVVGLFFRSIPPRGRTLVEVEIVRLLTGPADR